jgi:hypothetical protein
MNITESSIRCSSQVALLGAVTNNLRAVTVSNVENKLTFNFYYEHQPSDEEIEISEIVASEVLSDFTNVDVHVKRVILSAPQKIPNEGFWVYHKKE